MIEWLTTALYEPLTNVWFQKALIGGCLAAVACSVIGCFIILRRMAFLGDALAHAMLAGVTAGYLVMKLLFGEKAHAPGMLFGSLLAAVVTVGMISFISRSSRIKEDTAIGIMYTGIFAFGGALASLFSEHIHIDLLHFVVGQVLVIQDADLWVAAIVASVVLSIVLLFFRQLQLTTFDPIMAASIGIPVVAVDYLLTVCTSLVVVSGVSMLGVILIVGLLITPAGTAYMLCDRLSRMLWVAAAFGATGVIGGLYLCTWVDIAGGPAIVLFTTAQFLVVLAVAPRYGLIAGWLRRRRMVPQTLIEDVLRVVQKAGDQPVREATLATHIENDRHHLRRAIDRMLDEALLSREQDALSLTKLGRREAKRVQRAHRLWETYLDRLGTPTTELHDRAHQLEHIHDEDAVDYLDDKLGHPLTDPHGSEIPQDFEHVVPGNIVDLSLLREGNQATIESLGPAAAHLPLSVGMTIRVGPRTGDGETWNIALPDGQSLDVPHVQADDVMVRVEDVVV
ncbi:MAG: metal ABC transporter permease [Pirellulales bacterium]|nr:metal ABC transporter permease [Pirellulales bacterium]